jgi:hypothetical protein
MEDLNAVVIVIDNVSTNFLKRRIGKSKNRKLTRIKPSMSSPKIEVFLGGGLLILQKDRIVISLD